MTAVAELTLAGANVTVAFESALVMVPPVLGKTIVGGERPLAVFAVGSGVVVVVPVGVVVEPVAPVAVVLPPTTTEIVPVPEVVPAAGVVVPAPVFWGGAVVVSVAVVDDVVAGGEAEVPLVSPPTVVEPVDVEEPVDVPLPLVVVAGGVTVASLGWIVTGCVVGAGDVSVAGGVVVEPVEPVEEVELTVDGVVDETFELVPLVAWLVLEPFDGVTVTFVPASAACRAASAAACRSDPALADEFSPVSAGVAAGAAGFGSGIGRGCVSGTEMAGISTPMLSSYVGRFCALLLGFAGAGRVTYVFDTTGTRIERGCAWRVELRRVGDNARV